MEVLNAPSEYPQSSLPGFIKRINRDIANIKGIASDDLLRKTQGGMRESKINASIRPAYAFKVKNEAGGVRIIKMMKIKNAITLIRGSRRWIKLFNALYWSR